VSKAKDGMDNFTIDGSGVAPLWEDHGIWEAEPPIKEVKIGVPRGGLYRVRLYPESRFASLRIQSYSISAPPVNISIDIQVQ
jgi:hypothetical protein